MDELTFVGAVLIFMSSTIFIHHALWRIGDKLQGIMEVLGESDLAQKETL